ncbi:RNase P modulator RnpM [Bacillus badius]|uniref:Nucleic-acid-binding protein implicated in transcription termination n=1 Tax=Bacillus badius TaxID=1455 RepID=A0ABR5B0T9_BACBA|nr:YlxR family protein [Bacillus badius]KIL73609.1 putative nucleic-acid-binding protein [Bacillus badius]KIL80617.1 putative nucleic-acid-binding protein implicated in transcription termination [Bacillus badius]KZR57414.1 RNA-binding protein [Bacillus badius]MED4718124.1 YlxR family protein [Bacillus badius]
MNRPKKVPLRKCVATGEMKAKKEMVRIVRSKEGEVSVDRTGKKSGRGAYLSKTKEAVELARSKGILARQLNAEVPDSVFEELLSYVEKETN